MTADSFKTFLDAVAGGQGYYYELSDGTTPLPPCDGTHRETERARKQPAETGSVLTYSEISVATPSFADETPYIVTVAEFGPVRLTG